MKEGSATLPSLACRQRPARHEPIVGPSGEPRPPSHPVRPEPRRRASSSVRPEPRRRVPPPAPSPSAFALRLRPPPSLTTRPRPASAPLTRRLRSPSAAFARRLRPPPAAFSPPPARCGPRARLRLPVRPACPPLEGGSRRPVLSHAEGTEPVPRRSLAPAPTFDGQPPPLGLACVKMRVSPANSARRQRYIT
jgi:hypothetical protein